MSSVNMSRKNDLPEGAKLAYKGKIFEIWQWEQKMYDGSTETFETLGRSDTVEMVAVVGDKIMIEEQEQPDRAESFLSLPGGRIDDENVDPVLEAKREMLEETGYVSDDWASWCSITPHHRVAYSIHYFLARNCRKVAEQTLDNGERIRLRFVTFNEMLDLSDDPSFRGSETVKLFLRLRLDKKMREDFHKILFGR